jgi:sarcosine oxidase subunit alpha
VTAYDIGLQRMLSPKKEFIGKAAAARHGLLEPQRERLVGLKPVQAGGVLTAGARLFNEGATHRREHDQGYVTSVGPSPTLGHMIALGFLRHGPERMGERVVMVDHLRQIRTLCEVCPQVFFDPDGGRTRG